MRSGTPRDGVEYRLQVQCAIAAPTAPLPTFDLPSSLRLQPSRQHRHRFAEATVARQSRANRDFNCRGASASAARRYRAPLAAASPARRPSAAARASAAALRRSAEEASNPFCPWLDRPFYIVHVNALRRDGSGAELCAHEGSTAQRRVREESAAARTEVSSDCAREEPRWAAWRASGAVGGPRLSSPRARHAPTPPRAYAAPTVV